MSNVTSTHQFYAETYDTVVSGWPGELDFYRQLIIDEVPSQGAVLEIACGTGRVTTRLAETGVNIVGLDHSPEMLAIARGKSANLDNVRWVESDMCAFELNKQFDLVIILDNMNVVFPSAVRRMTTFMLSLTTHDSIVSEVNIPSTIQK